MSTSPCEKHELTGCATCSGAEARYNQSLKDQPLLADPDSSLPYIPGGVTIHSKFPGYCASCGRPWDVGTPIHRAYGENDHGWIGVECCVGYHA